MLHIRIDSVTEILFRQLKSNAVTAIVTLCPIGLTKKFPFLLEKCDSYAQEIVSFPIDDPSGLAVHISMKFRNASDEWVEFAELSLSLKPMKMNRWSRAMFRMAPTFDVPAPLIVLSVHVSDSDVAPFSCHRTHFPVASIEKEPDAVQCEDVMARIWMRLIEQRDWPMAMRSGFAGDLEKAVSDCERETEHAKACDGVKSRPRNLNVMKREDAKWPLAPPEPTNEMSGMCYGMKECPFME